MLNLILFYGSESILNQLNGFELTDDPTKAVCAVVEMPGNLAVLEQLNGIPVIVVSTGMLNYKEAKATKRSGIITVQPEQLVEEINKILASSKPPDSDDDDMFFFEEEQAPPIKQATAVPKQTVNTFIPPKPEPRPTLAVPPQAPKPITPAPRASVEPFQQQPGSRQSMINPPSLRQTEAPAILQRRGGRRASIGVSFSAGGGVGKTTIASNIGCTTALMGIPTVAVDLDLGYGDLDTATGLVDPTDRTKIIKAKAPADGWVTVSDWRRYAVSLKQNILQHNSGLYVIPAYPYAGDDLSESEVEELLYSVSEIFGFVVVDLGVDGFSPHARVALRMADVVMMVGGQDEKTIGKISHFLKQEGGYNNKMSLVINKVSPTGFYSPGEVAKKLGFDRYYEIPLDEKGINAAKKQRKLVVQLPGSAAGDALKRYAAEVLPFKLDAPPQGKKTEAFSFMNKIKSLFKRG